MIDAIVGFVVWLLVDVLFVSVGKMVICLLTLGRWRGERGNEGRIYGAAGALTFVRDGQRVLTDRVAATLGVFFCVGLVVCLLSLTTL